MNETGRLVDLGAGITHGFGSDTLVGIENLNISAYLGDWTVYGSDAGNHIGIRGPEISGVIDARGGDDMVSTFSSALSIDGGAGLNTLQLLRLASLPSFTHVFTPGAAGSIGATSYANFQYLDLEGSPGDDTLTLINPLYSQPFQIGYQMHMNRFQGGGGNDTAIVDLSMTNSRLVFDGLSIYTYVNGINPALFGSFFDVENFRITAGSGNDDLRGQAGNDVMSGGYGDDFLTGGLGNDLLDGGEGSDTARYAGNQLDYVVSRKGDTLTVSNGAQTDTLTDVEYLAFDDGTFTAQYFALPATTALQNQVTFLSGVTSGGLISRDSFAAWDSEATPNNPATYKTTGIAAGKWTNNSNTPRAGQTGGTITYFFDNTSNWNPTEKGMFNSALALWSAVASISFVEGSGQDEEGRLKITRGNNGAFAEPSYVTTEAGAGNNGSQVLYRISKATLSIDTSGSFGPLDGSFSTKGGDAWHTVLHEVGHALGLGHGGPYNSNVDITTQQFNEYDFGLWTIMSYINPNQINSGQAENTAKFYNQYPVTGTNWGVTRVPAQGGGFQIYNNGATTMMSLDIAAIQRLYGTPTSTPFDGGETYGFNTNIHASVRNFYDFTVNTAPVVTLWNSGTNNTLDVSGFSSNSTINLNPGTFSSAGTSVNSAGTTTSMVNNIGINYDTAIDRLYTGIGNDNVVGNDNNNFIFGGTGTNTINGAGGNDTASYALARAVYTITQNGGALTISGNSTLDTLTSIEFLSFSDQTIAVSSLGSTGPARPGDFNGDGRSDLLMHNGSGQAAIWNAGGTGLSNVGSPVSTGWQFAGSTDYNGDGKSDIVLQYGNGQTEVWMMNGSAIQSAASFSPPANGNWKIATTGDFNGDGNGDVLMQNGSGQAAIWFANSASLVNVGGAVSSGWQFKSAGDYNGDGKSDVMLQYTDGQIEVWMMNGSTIQSYSNFVTPNSNWKIAGAGDFNGDGKADILFQNGSGQAAIRLSGGSSLVNVGSPVSPGWLFKGAKDFDGDGKSDIVLQYADGQTEVWMMNGSTVQSYSNFSPPNSSWKIVSDVAKNPSARSDFNGDGKGDILLQNDGSQAAIWLAGGSSLSTVGSPASNGWQFRGLGDYNGDGRGDIVLQYTDGQTEVWMMNGSTILSTYNLNPAPNSSWKYAGTGDFNADGKDDILMQNGGGQAAVWLSGGTGLTNVGGVVSNGWEFKATGDYNGDGRSDIVMQYSDGQTEVWMMSGSSILSTYNLNPAPNSSWKVAGTGDFNGDGKSDILMHNGSGQAAIWASGGSSLVNVGSPVSTGWQFKGSTDFNGDGRSDIVMQYTNGQTEVWMMNGSTIQSTSNFSPPNSSWAIVSDVVQSKSVRSDINADGKADIFWRSDAGTTAAWHLNGASVVGDTFIGTISNVWQIKGIGDVNGDGKADLIWQNDNGQAGISLAGSSSITNVGGNPGTTWKVQGTGDINGDGKADILWRSDAGTVAAWHMNGASVIGDTFVGTQNNVWTIKGMGDANGDGKADILWQNDNGQAGITLAGASSITNISSNPGTTWTVSGVGDINGDGKADLLWRSDAGTVVAWHLNGTSVIGDTFVGTQSNAWTIKNFGDTNADGKADIIWQNNNGQAGLTLAGTSTINAIGSNPGASWHVMTG